MTGCPIIILSNSTNSFIISECVGFDTSGHAIINVGSTHVNAGFCIDSGVHGLVSSGGIGDLSASDNAKNALSGNTAINRTHRAGIHRLLVSCLNSDDRTCHRSNVFGVSNGDGVVVHGVRFMKPNSVSINKCSLVSIHSNTRRV